MFAGCSAAVTPEKTEPDVSTAAVSSLATVGSDVITVTSSVTTVADAGDEVVEASDVESNYSPSYPEHVKQA